MSTRIFSSIGRLSIKVKWEINKADKKDRRNKTKKDRIDAPDLDDVSFVRNIYNKHHFISKVRLRVFSSDLSWIDSLSDNDFEGLEGFLQNIPHKEYDIRDDYIFLLRITGYMSPEIPCVSEYISKLRKICLDKAFSKYLNDAYYFAFLYDPKGFLDKATYFPRCININGIQIDKMCGGILLGHHFVNPDYIVSLVSQKKEDFKKNPGTFCPGISLEVFDILLSEGQDVNPKFRSVYESRGSCL